MPRPRLESASWWPKLLKDMDHMSLRDLADKYDVSINGLSRALRRGGTPKSDRPAPAGRKPKGGRKAVAPPPVVVPASDPNSRGAEGLSWWPEFLQLKDTHTLGDLAVRFGVAEITLQRAMKRAGVSRRSLRGQGRKGSTPVAPPAPVVTPRVATATVVAPPAPAAAPAPVAKRAAALSGEAWQVRIRQKGEVLKFVIVARDIGDAAAQVQAALGGSALRGGSVEGLEFLGTTI